MKRHIARLLLGVAAAIFSIGSVVHFEVYGAHASSAITRSNLPPFLAAELKGLWLADSTTLMAMALIAALLAVKPAAATRMVIILLAAVPAGTTALLYLFLGPFYAAHLLTAASAMVVVAGLLTPGRRETLPI